MSYLTIYKRVARKRPPGVIVGLLVAFVLLSIPTGCIVTSTGQSTGHKCGPQCTGHHYTPTRVTAPTTPSGIPAEPTKGPVLETPPTEIRLEPPQASTGSKDWQPVAKASVQQTKNVPVHTARRTTPQPQRTSSPNLLSALFPPLHSSPTNLQQQQLRQQQEQQRRQAALLQTPQQQQRYRQVAQTVQNPTPWYDPLGLLGQPTSPIAKPATVQKTVAQQPSVRPLPTTTMNRSVPQSSQRIAQVSYEKAPQTAQITEPKRLPTTQTRVSMSSQASPELHKPWNMDEFRPQYASSNNPYRLVSDTQSASTDRTAPPAIDITRLTGKSSATQSRAQNIETAHQRMPIFGLGRELMKELRPSNDRKWSQNHAVLQTASFNGNLATVHNVRYSKYENGEIATTRYYDATFDLNDIRTIDLVIVPFRGAPRLAHVQASFGFADGRHIGMSIEARYEEGEKYDALGSTMRQFELIYVLADERDLLRIGTEVNKNDVHVYRLKFEPTEVREMFVDALNRANTLAAKPEFYHPLRNSCVTNLIAHINKGRPKAIPKEYRTLLPGLLDNYAYDLKLVDTTAKTFKEAKENAKINWLVEKYGDLEYFSAGIRQNMY